ncbi:hypothetical protein ACFQ08_42360, partial [Streptosporangium algeriense]
RLRNCPFHVLSQEQPLLVCSMNLALFADGVSVHAILHDEPVDAAFVTEMATRLLKRGAEAGR